MWRERKWEWIEIGEKTNDLTFKLFGLNLANIKLISEI